MASAAVLWSLAGLFIKVLDWPPLTIAGFRSLIAFAVILIYLKRPHLHWSFPQVAAALANAVTMILFVWANKATTSANAILLQYVGPVFTAFIAAWLLKERVRLEQGVAFLFVVGGMAMMFMDKLGGGHLSGNILAVLSGLTFSFYFVFMRMQKDGSPLESILLSHGLTAVIGIGASLFMPAPRLTWGAIGAVAVLGVVQVGLSAILFAFAIKRVSAVSANLVAVLEPICNPLWVFLVLGEAPGLRAIGGGVVILVAVTAASLINARRSSFSPAAGRETSPE